MRFASKGADVVRVITASGQLQVYGNIDREQHVTTLRAVPKLFPPVRSSQTCFIVLAYREFSNTRVIRGCDRAENPSSCGTASYGRGPADFCNFGSPCRKRTLFLVGNVDSRDWHRLVRKCAGTGGHCCVIGEKHVHPRASTSRSECCSSRDHTPPPRLSLAFAMVRTMNARRFQRTHLLRGTGTSISQTKDFWMGIVDPVLTF